MDGPENDCSKIAAEKLKVVRELSWHEVLDIVNTGIGNSGHRNSGDRNSCDHSSGIFNTQEQPLFFFNKPSSWYMKDWIESDAKRVLMKMKLTQWVHEEDMSDKEKKANPDFYVRKGYLKVYDYKEACRNMWKELTDSEKETIQQLPNFDKDVFKEIAGIDIDND